MDVFSAVGPEVQTKSACSGPGGLHTYLNGEEPVLHPPGLPTWRAARASSEHGVVGWEDGDGGGGEGKGVGSEL